MGNEILRKNAIKKDVHANFPEYWVKCWKSFRSQLALIRTAASSGVFNDSSSEPTLAWKANAAARADPRECANEAVAVKLTRRWEELHGHLRVTPRRRLKASSIHNCDIA